MRRGRYRLDYRLVSGLCKLRGCCSCKFLRQTSPAFVGLCRAPRECVKHQRVLQCSSELFRDTNDPKTRLLTSLSPVRTIATAMILYHRLLLFNKTTYFQENAIEPSIASLFVACKIEDTLKKSREILCVSYNLRHPNSEPINPDSSLLEEISKRVIGMERTILETSSFDFRNRHAQPFLMKLCKRLKLGKETARLAWSVALDVYRTLAPLRATPHALALAAIETATRLGGKRVKIEYSKLEATRDDVLCKSSPSVDCLPASPSFAGLHRASQI
jgi:hypothetical protein